VPWIWLPTIGLLGGFLRLRQTPPTKVARWDIAFTGLLAGFTVTVACSVIGAAWSIPVSSSRTMARFWAPHLIWWLTGDHLAWHPLLMAARIGWCLTVVALIPVPPFDGGRLFWIIPSIWRVRRWQVWALGLVCLCCWI
jgi:Zn-dependent protease